MLEKIDFCYCGTNVCDHKDPQKGASKSKIQCAELLSTHLDRCAVSGKQFHGRWLARDGAVLSRYYGDNGAVLSVSEPLSVHELDSGS